MYRSYSLQFGATSILQYLLPFHEIALVPWGLFIPWFTLKYSPWQMHPGKIVFVGNSSKMARFRQLLKFANIFCAILLTILSFLHPALRYKKRTNCSIWQPPKIETPQKSTILLLVLNIAWCTQRLKRSGAQCLVSKAHILFTPHLLLTLYSKLNQCLK